MTNTLQVAKKILNNLAFFPKIIAGHVVITAFLTLILYPGASRAGWVEWLEQAEKAAAEAEKAAEVAKAIRAEKAAEAEKAMAAKKAIIALNTVKAERSEAVLSVINALKSDISYRKAALSIIADPLTRAQTANIIQKLTVEDLATIASGGSIPDILSKGKISREFVLPPDQSASAEVAAALSTKEQENEFRVQAAAVTTTALDTLPPAAWTSEEQLEKAWAAELGTQSQAEPKSNILFSVDLPEGKIGFTKELKVGRVSFKLSLPIRRILKAVAGTAVVCIMTHEPKSEEQSAAQSASAGQTLVQICTGCLRNTFDWIQKLLNTQSARESCKG
jgi:hypothetical protein